MIKEVLTSVRNTCIWLLAPIGMLAAFSCQDDVVSERQSVAAGDEIVFSVASDSVIAARSRTTVSSFSHRQFLTTIGKDSLFLYTRIEENTEQPSEQSIVSRAAENTESSIKQKSFYLDAFYNESTPFMNATKVNWKDGVWQYAPIKYWPNNEGDYVDFYGYMTVPTTFGWTTKHQTFNYTLPSNANEQQDLIFAQALNQTKQTVNGKVVLDFYHALSAVLFKVGTLPSDITIGEMTIALNNVKSSGTCSISNTNNVLSFAWNTDNSSLESYSQNFVKNDGYGNGDDISKIDSELAFMMIPHTFEGNAMLNISFEINGKSYSFDHPLAITDEEGEVTYDGWSPNTKYTYILSIKESVEVDVDDVVSGENNTIKSDVKIQNTGLADVYMRAAIVGYWVNENGDVVASWDIKDDVGTFVGLNNDNWFEQGGFYYHKNIVKVADFTSALFDKYTLTKSPPIVGASLELNIVVQAVDADENMPWSGISVTNGSLTKAN